MHSFGRHMHGSADNAPASAANNATVETKGLTLDGGWRYDMMLAVMDATLFRGGLRGMRRATIARADIQPGERVLDVGCGTGTLALMAQRRVGTSGGVVGVDPSPVQIARARAQAARRHLPTVFQSGVIELLDFPDASFDVVLSSLMMHHLPTSLKRQGLAEIARVLKPGGRLVIADFKRKQDRQGRAARFHAGGSDLGGLEDLVRAAAFDQVGTEELPPPRFSMFPGAGVLTTRKGAA
jgi:ubiquinone/menaquinone biosynthesis C-methylase UbiE